ncbi:MAG: hypothetical protein ACC642_11780, partial [Pseudomonadales bacterium]
GHSEIIQADREVEAVAQRSGDPKHRAMANYTAGTNQFYGGDMAQARRLLNQAQDYFRERPDSDKAGRFGVDGPVFLSNLTGAWASVLAGYPEEAENTLQIAAQLMDADNDPFALMQILLHGCVVKQDWGDDPRRVLENAERILETIEQYNLPGWRPLCQINRGWSRAMLGDAGGVEEIASGVSTDGTGGTTRGHSLVMLAEAQMTIDDRSGAMESLDLSIRSAGGHISSFFISAAHRMKAELLWQDGAMEEADNHFRDALDVARQRNARMLELRAATSYADFLDQTGDSDVGHKHLLRVTDEFAGGRDSPYMQQALQLLARLHNRRPISIEL